VGQVTITLLVAAAGGRLAAIAVLGAAVLGRGGRGLGLGGGEARGREGGEGEDGEDDTGVFHDMDFLNLGFGLLTFTAGRSARRGQWWWITALVAELVPGGRTVGLREQTDE
jgi:hypothetical protein